MTNPTIDNALLLNSDDGTCVLHFDYFGSTRRMRFNSDVLALGYLSFLCEVRDVRFPDVKVESDLGQEPIAELELVAGRDDEWLKSVAHIGPKRQTVYPFDLA